MRAGEDQREKTTSLDILRHPIRVRIVEVCNLRDRLSPIEILHQGLVADLESVRGKRTEKQKLSHIAYHCRRLQEGGLIEVVAELPRRGAVEHFYKATGQAFFSDEEWAALLPGERFQISKVMWQSFIARVENAMMEHTFDARLDRWLAWRPLKLDEKGWKQMAVSVAACYAEIEQIKRDAEERLAVSGDEPVEATYGIFTFQSPTR